MSCPVCKTVELVNHELEPNLSSQQCPNCGGQWISAERYWTWLRQHGENLPERTAAADLPVTDNAQAKQCPDCRHILLRYRVGHDIPFQLDHCGHCNGIWFDRNEWEILKSRNLHDDVHFVFTEAWQAGILKLEQAIAREEFLRSRFGDADFEEMRRVKAWIDGHPRRSELLAYLGQK
jgi:Zn-finger nucleic acid-binding protein